MKSNGYEARCQKRLEEWYAPISDWYCTDVIDIEEEASDTDLFTCELCGCSRVRFVHVMEHDDYFEDVRVGCICAGIMEGDVLAAKERERLMKNRAKRKRNFPNRKWKETPYGTYILMHKGSWIKMIHSKFNDQHYGVSYNGEIVWKYKGRPITNFLSATYAAFDLVDPVERIMRP
ncbi:MAG: hypothetical protein KMY55_07955 [Dethiosulfatibacter sp.]|jgi:hypothetical protein|nr:hypothetical protein [Dethiosulfatibacter sp.]